MKFNSVLSPLICFLMFVFSAFSQVKADKMEFKTSHTGSESETTCTAPPQNQSTVRAQFFGIESQNSSPNDRLLEDLRTLTFSSRPLSILSTDILSGTVATFTETMISNLLINGSNPATVTVDDSIIITFQFTSGSISALLYIYVDANENQVVDAGDAQIDYPIFLLDNSVHDLDANPGSMRFTLFPTEDGGIGQVNAHFVLYVDDGYASSAAALDVQQRITGYSLSGSVIPANEKIIIFANSESGDEYVTISDQDGNYTLYLPDDTPRHWEIGAADYLTLHGNLIPPAPQTIYVNSTITNYNLMFQNPDAWVQGNVSDDQNNPVSGLHIIAANEIPEFLIDTTDAEGYYLGGVLYGMEHIWLTIPTVDLWPGYMAPFISDVLINPFFGDTITQDLTVYAADSYISGHVYLDGAPLYGGLVVAFNMDYSGMMLTTTNQDGSYTLPVSSLFAYMVLSGGYPQNIVITSDGYNWIESGSTDIDFTLKTLNSGIEGYVTDYLTGDPIKNAEVYLYNDSTSDYYQTGDNGYYRLIVPPGDYQFGAGYTDYVWVSQQGKPITDELIRQDFRLVQYGNCTLAGTVTDEEGVPLAYARAELYDYYNMDAWVMRTNAGVDGHYEFTDIFTGYYLLRCFANYIDPGYISEYYDDNVRREGADIVYGVPGETTDTLDFKLRIGGGITGLITEEGTGTPLPGVHVTAYEYESGEQYGYAYADTGFFHIKALPDGNYGLQAAMPGFYSEFFDNVTNPYMATAVSVTVPEITENIHFELSRDNSMYRQTAANLQTSLRRNGVIGCEGNPFWKGCEWPSGSGTNYLYEGGIWVGTNITGPNVVTNSYDREFKPHVPLFRLDSRYSDEDVEIWYDDDRTSNWQPLGLKVHQSSYAWNGADFILFKYVFYSDGRWGPQQYYIGFFMDYDIAYGAPGSFSGDDMTGYDSEYGISYMYDDDGDDGLSPGVAGIKILNHEPSMHGAWSVVDDPYEDWQKWNYLSGNSFAPNSEVPDDYRIVQGTGPVSLGYGDSATVFMAFAIGNSLAGLQTSIAAADSKYRLITGILPEENTDPVSTFRLYQNYPNPFNSWTVIRYAVGTGRAVSLQVELSIYNIMGQEITTLVSESQSAGEYTVTWDASEYPSGIYYCRLTSKAPDEAAHKQTMKMIFIR